MNGEFSIPPKDKLMGDMMAAYVTAKRIIPDTVPEELTDPAGQTDEYQPTSGPEEEKSKDAHDHGVMGSRVMASFGSPEGIFVSTYEPKPKKSEKPTEMKIDKEPKDNTSGGRSLLRLLGIKPKH